MKLNQKEKSVLTLGIAEALRNTTVFRRSASLFEIDKKYIDDDLEQKIEKSCLQGDLDEFIVDRLNLKLGAAGVLPHDSTSFPLTSLSEFSDVMLLSAEIVEELSSLPWSYKMYARGPAGMYAGSSNNPIQVEITSRFGLISSHMLDDNWFTSNNSNLDQYQFQGSLEPHARHFAPKHIYFYFYFTGYIPRGGFNTASNEFEAEIRAFYGTCIAYDLIWPSESRFLYLELQHLVKMEKESLVTNGPLSNDVSRAGNFWLREDVAKRFRTSASATCAFQPVIKLFNCPNSSRLKTAAIWIFRAESTSSDMDRVLESTIALEVLLGDRAVADKVGLTRLMSNRCAYALASNENERREIASNFEKYYGLRSKIVHEGKIVFGDKEEDLVYWGLMYSNRMLRHEASLSCADAEK